MPRPKLLHVIETLGRGGAETELVYLLPALQERGFNCEVAAVLAPFTLASELENAGVKVHCLNIGWQWNIHRAVAALASLGRSGSYDVLHGHNFLGGMCVGLTKPLLPRSKRVVNFHNLGYDSYPASNWKRKLLKVVNGFVMRNCMDAYVAVSKPVAAHFELHLGLQSVAVIPNAFPCESMQAATQERATIRARYGISREDFLCVMPGRFVPEKGHRYLLEAHVLLPKSGLPVKTLLFGDGWLAEEVKREIEVRGLGADVQVHRAVPRGELMEVLSAADLMVMSSTHEGFSLASAEAMLLGVPVVATAVGGVPELIEDGVSGMLVPARDVEALAATIRMLRADPGLRRRLGEQGRERIRKNFGVEAVVPRWEKFYSRVLREKQSVFEADRDQIAGENVGR
jgi:glycosyltransferase involved in cell wall biosynthesis